MSLSAKYQAFLASPSAAALTERASLHYITTLTSINDAAAILKHLTMQEKLLKKKSEKILSAIEGPDGLCVDVETTLEFIAGGGAYLPGLDDNFVADRIVTFPMVHIVNFEGAHISQVRLYWDQGSLLKQIDVIGARARNWPIRDGKDQARLIAKSSGSVTGRSTGSQDDPTASSRPVSSRSTTSNAMNDPHATLSLFQPREINEERSYSHPIHPRMQSAKPPPREYSELFVGEIQGSPTPGQAGQNQRIAVKAGGGKNFKPNRLFDEEQDSAPTPRSSVKTNAKKYSHFEFGDGEDEDEATPKGRPSIKTKHQSQWDFEDFVTPEKTNPKILAQSVRHFGWSDDEDEGSPVRRPIVHKARPDADPHFEFKDDGTPEAVNKPISTKGRMQNKGMGLYKDHVLGSESDGEDDGPRGDTKRVPGDVSTVVKNEHRKKDFGSQWEMKDESPGLKAQLEANKGKGNGKVLKSLDSNWDHYEKSPAQTKKENVDKARGINISGNGMGGRKGVDMGWSIGDEEQEYPAYTKPKPSDERGGQKPLEQSKKENVDKSRGINISGNGMGGRKGVDMGWSIGDESDNNPASTKAHNTRAAESKNFWDF